MTSIPSAFAQKFRGRFVVLDGPDGSGKSTQFRYLASLFSQANLQVCEVREPGGTPIGERIRQILLDPVHAEMNVRCEMLLYMASRAQLITQRIGPALDQGCLVLADRFISSTLAYQGAAGGMLTDDILRVGRIAVGACWPDLIILFDVDENTAASRLSSNLDRMEQKGREFHRTVRQGYLAQAQAEPDRYLVIDATADAATVSARLLVALEERLQRLGW